MMKFIFFKFFCPKGWGSLIFDEIFFVKLQMHSIILILTLLTLTLAENTVRAQTNLSGLIINADDYEYNSKKKTATLRGNVQVVFEGNHLRADIANIDIEAKFIKASGNVILQNQKVYVGAERIEFNYESKIGIFYNSFVKSGQAVFEGEVIEKVGENQYVAQKASYSTCETCPGAWSFSGRKITAELGGYAWITRPVLRIADIPVVILPGIIIPLKSRRQSGFLVPSYSWSKNGGHALTQNYFWAISRSSDATFGLKNYEKRGLKSMGQYRYSLSKTDKGVLNAAHIRDRAFANEDDIESSIDRWYVNYSHRLEMPGDLIQRVNLSAVSDLRYPNDFPKELDASGDPSLKNTVSLTKLGQSQMASIEATYNINLLKKNPLASNEDTIHRLPEVNYHLTSKRLFNTDLTSKLHLNYVNFTRPGLAYDDIEQCPLLPGTANNSKCVQEERDGKFDPSGPFGDILRTGQRLDITPTLTYPMLLGNTLELVPSVKYRETQYYFNLGSDDTTENYSNSAARRYLETNLSAGVQFSRTFGQIDETSHKGQKYKHEFEPKISYTNIPWLKDPEHGFFGNFRNQPYSRSLEPIANEDLDGSNGIQFDYNDRVFDTRLINLSLSNKIVRKRWAGDNPDYRSLFVAKLEQSYDLNEAKSKDLPQPWLPINGLLSLNLDHFDSYTIATHYPYAKITNWSSRMRFTNSRGSFVELLYSFFVRVNDQNQIEENTKTETTGTNLGFTSKYLNLSGGLHYSLVTKEISQWGAAAVIKPPGDCVAFYLTGLIIPATNDPHISFDVRFNFGEN